MYIKCPRCQLNYINEETEQFCKVCLVDMGKIQGGPELELDEEYKLCPECGENYLDEGEEICFACRNERIKRGEGKNEDSVDSYEEGEDMLPDSVDDSLESMAEMENESEEQAQEAESEESPF